MKILHVLPTLGKGGGARVVIDLANYAIRNGHEVSMIVVQDSPVQNIGITQLIDPRIKLVFALQETADTPLSGSNYDTYLKALYWLKFLIYITINLSLFKKQNVVHVHMPIASIGGSYLFILKKFFKKFQYVVIETVHSDSKSLKKSTTFFYKMNWKLRDGLIFEIRHKDYLNYNKKYPNQNATYIPLGVEIISNSNQKFENNKIRRKINIPLDNIVIGQVGRINIQDRQTDKYILLFELLQNSPTRKYNYTFLMYGDGFDKEKIESQVEFLRLSENTLFLGFTNNLEQAFSIIDFYITLNITTDSGIAGLQAITYGLPTLAIQGDKTYQTGENDWIPNFTNLHKLKNLIEKLIDNKHLKDDLILRQKKYFKSNVSVEKMGRNTVDFYKNIFNEAKN